MMVKRLLEMLQGHVLDIEQVPSHVSTASLSDCLFYGRPVDLAIGEEVSKISLADGAGLDHLLHPKGPASLCPPVQHIPLTLHITTCTVTVKGCSEKQAPMRSNTSISTWLTVSALEKVCCQVQIISRCKSTCCNGPNNALSV